MCNHPKGNGTIISNTLLKRSLKVLRTLYEFLRTFFCVFCVTFCKAGRQIESLMQHNIIQKQVRFWPELDMRDPIWAKKGDRQHTFVNLCQYNLSGNYHNQGVVRKNNIFFVSVIFRVLFVTNRGLLQVLNPHVDINL